MHTAKGFSLVNAGGRLRQTWTGPACCLKPGTIQKLDAGMEEHPAASCPRPVLVARAGDRADRG